MPFRLLLVLYQFPFLKHVEVCDRGELNNRFRKAGLCLRKWPDCIFLHLLIQSFWVPCDLSSKNFSKKNPYYLKLRFMYQDMPRMQDFAPFTPELLGALNDTPAIRTTSQARWAGLIGQPNNFLDNLNFDLGCPNDY